MPSLFQPLLLVTCSMWENGLPNSASTTKKIPFALWNIGNHPKSIYSGRPYLWNAERLSINDYIHVNQINLMFYWIFSWISEKFDLCWQWYKVHRNICENINDFQVIIHDMQMLSCVSWDYWVLNCWIVTYSIQNTREYLAFCEIQFVVTYLKKFTLYSKVASYVLENQEEEV